MCTVPLMSLFVDVCIFIIYLPENSFQLLDKVSYKLSILYWVKKTQPKDKEQGKIKEQLSELI